MPAKKIDDIALLQLLNFGGKNVKELAEILGVKKNAMSQKLKRWKARGIVKISPAETLMKRREKCTPDKVFILTKRGRRLYEESLHFCSGSLRGGDALPPSNEESLHALTPRPRRLPQSLIDDFAPQITDRPPPPSEVHGLCYQIPIEGEPGIYPPHLKEKRMQNWSKIYGNFMGAYIEFTTKNIFIWLNGVDETTDKVKEKCEERVKKIWVALKHNYGWEIKPIIHRYNHTTGQRYNDIPVDELQPYKPNTLPKYAVLNAPEYSNAPSPQLGKYGEIDDTPNIYTFHAPKPTIDMITENHRIFAKYRDKFLNPADYIESLKQIIAAMSDDIVGEAALKAKMEFARDMAQLLTAKAATGSPGSVAAPHDSAHPPRGNKPEPGPEVQ